MVTQLGTDNKYYKQNTQTTYLVAVSNFSLKTWTLWQGLF